MIGAWNRLADRLAHREPATPLALFRVAIGLCILGTLISMIRADVVRLVWMDRPYGGFRDLGTHHWLVQALGGPTDAAVLILVSLGILGGALLVVGLGGRISALLALQVCIALFSIHPGSGGGHDRLLQNALWLLVLSPSTATLSLDAKLFSPEHRFVRTAPVAAWPRYLVIFQLVLLYTTTGMQKLGQEWMPWGGFTALYYALLNPHWQRWDTSWLGHPVAFFGTQVGTVATWLWETLAPLWLLAFWFRATRGRPGRLRAACNGLDLRSAWAAFGIALHLVLWVTMDLGPFSPVTLSFYLCLWHHDEWVALGRRLSRRA